MPQLDFQDFAPQLIWLAITFTALYLIMARVALPRIATVIEQRRDRIASDLDKAEQLKKQTEDAIAAYEQAIAEARAKAHTIAQEARDKLAAEIDEERAEVEKQIADQTAEAETRIQAAKAAALAHVSDVAADTATEIVKRLIGGRVTKAEVGNAVGKALSS
ncbi:MAG: ATP F0F1 synthase subunit B [Hyphomicrobiales bacterium]|nr:ATP F0F1 synthase subunit B [Hyphomicrobiales bacterium]